MRDGVDRRGDMAGMDRRAFIASACAMGVWLVAGSETARAHVQQPPRTRPGRDSTEPGPSEPTPVPPGYFAWAALSDRVLFAPGDGGNALLLLAPRGGACVLVDAKMPYVATTLRREAEQRGGRIETVINTHHHLDHIGGNLAFSADTRIVAHANAKPRVAPQLERLRQFLKSGVRTVSNSDGLTKEQALKDAEALAASADTIAADRWAPTQTFSGRIGSANLGAMPIDLHQVGAGHTDNDVIVHAPQLDIVHMGDLLFHNLYPFIDRDSGASVRDWIKTLKYAKRLCKPKTIVVPGHGEVTDVKGIDGMIEFFETSMEFVQKQIRQKKPREEVVAMTVPGQESRGFEHLRERAMGAMYDELMG